MSIKHNPKAGFKLLFDFWGKYHAIDHFHYQWVKDNLKVKIVKRGEQLSSADRHSEMTFFVAKGLLARVEENTETGKRRIMSLAIPNMALMTTNHLYTHHLHSGRIVALRSGIIIAIPHSVLRQFQEQEKSIDTLIDILGNKKKRQLVLLRQATLGYSPFERYLNFARLLPEIKAATTQIEQADLLGISRHTVQQAQYFLLTGKYAQK
ncbi:hypothetical protein [Sphingobacterium sp. UGAL515B_05]|uniref:Crp/Fnr family transcriptional regulator n=1 Tax=Sphingobacterium sp. UGAL515B_05 TaxID=2986767 RepID=UPI0029542242|nr:hypothetical protein [Sphingobacterium sp. UGAL515B_05]WON96111.1 hypothetical protein OK025_06785 [Sphingobacterium sp. UGAL515B_05]